MRLLGRGRLAMAAVLLFFTSCSDADDDGRKPVFPVKGEVFVNGKPAANVFVYLHPAEPDAEHPMRPYAQADENGAFAISTYVSGDGAPAGEYVVTFEWLTYNPLGNQWSGPDKLKRRYQDSKTSKFRVHVEEKPNTLSRFELTTN